MAKTPIQNLDPTVAAILAQRGDQVCAFGFWLSGFVDGEGYFILKRHAERSAADGIRRDASFGIDLRLDDLVVLEKIQLFLGCGKISIRQRNGANPQASYQVKSTADLFNKIIPFFNQYPLVAKKSRDFKLWKKGVSVLNHVRSKMVRRKLGGGTLSKWDAEERSLFDQFHHQLRCIRQYVEPVIPIDEQTPPAADWFAGITDGEGCFRIRTNEFKGNWRGDVTFGVNLRYDDLAALTKAKALLGCGRVYQMKQRGKDRPQACYAVENASDLANIIVPFFEKHELRAKKQRDFSIWKQAVHLAYQVKSRPTKCRGSGNGKGILPMWTSLEKERFNQLNKELRDIRVFQDPRGV